jgi:hypothetical protein
MEENDARAAIYFITTVKKGPAFPQALDVTGAPGRI